ncbi:MAG: hypothetical protein ACJAZS_000631 [Alteromonas naphthalenivorans]|jgi:uncharacterized protein (TIGR00251 family)
MALILEIKVVPQSGKSCFELDKKGDLKCFLKSAPEKGAANKELIKLLSKQLKIPQNDIEIIAGLIVRKKKIKLHIALTFEEFCDKMGLSHQENLIF